MPSPGIRPLCLKINKGFKGEGTVEIRTDNAWVKNRAFFNSLKWKSVKDFLSFEAEGTFMLSESFVENIKYNIKEKNPAIIPYKKKIIIKKIEQKV